MTLRTQRRFMRFGCEIRRPTRQAIYRLKLKAELRRNDAQDGGSGFREGSYVMAASVRAYGDEHVLDFMRSWAMRQMNLPEVRRVICQAVPVQFPDKPLCLRYFKEAAPSGAPVEAAGTPEGAPGVPELPLIVSLGGVPFVRRKRSDTKP